MYAVLLLSPQQNISKQRKQITKMKGIECRLMLLYHLSAASYCFCSASTASATKQIKTKKTNKKKMKGK